jgi:lysophospholipase L1-like esterase
MPDNYDTPADLIGFEHQLVHLAKAIGRGNAKIVAIGSSSTQGVGASSPEWSYPSRLAIELTTHYPGVSITVENKGVGGQEAGDELARFKKDVFALDPDLVVWQVGTNAVAKDYDFSEVEFAIDRGLRRLKQRHADIILMDPQYAGQVTDNPDHERMIRFISSTAKKANVNVFRRFDLMKHWIDNRVPIEQLINPDRLHQNDWSYLSVTRALATAIVEAVARPSAASRPAASGPP